MADTADDLRRLARELCEQPPMLFSLDLLHEAAALAHHDPAALTDRHLQHIALYEPHTILPLLQKRAAAVQRRADEAYTAAQTHATDQPRPAAAAPDRQYTPGRLHTTAIMELDTKQLEGMTFKTLCATYPDTPVTLATLGHLVEFANDMNERNKDRNAKIAALEAAHQKMQERILELEAQRVIHDVRP